MTAEAKHEIAEIGVRLLDGAYVAWLVEETESERALRAWLDAGWSNHEAYLAYRASVEREEAAARDLERLWTLAGPCEDTLACHEERALG